MSDGFQLRHKEFGVYQGNCMGLGFWHPMSDMPEQGYCRFPTREDAIEHIEYLTSVDRNQPLKSEDLSVEPFDKAESDRLIESSPYK